MSLTADQISLLKSVPRPLTATVTAPKLTWEDGTPMGRPAPEIISLFGPATESLADGVHEELPPLDPAGVIKGCPFFRQALFTGGRDLNQPQWMYTTLASTWFEDGHNVAHKLANQHPGYTPESTDAMWERKLRERENNPSLGWPSCRSIEQSGFAGCAGCPHRGKIQSPLHLHEAKAAAKPNPTPAGSPAATSSYVPTPATDAFVDLPEGYQYGSDWRIYAEVIEKTPGKKNAPPEERMTLVPLFTCTIKNAWVEKGESNALHFTFSRDIKSTGGRHWGEGRFTWGEIGKPEKIVSTLLDAGVICNPHIKGELVKVFLMSWLDKLQNEVESNETVPFGWFNDTDGFAYDGTLYLKDGQKRPSGVLEDLRGRFTAKGDDTTNDWLNAFETVRTLSCPANMIAVASAFGSPLMRFSGEAGGVLSLHGRGGAGKTSAAKLGMAVWGDPRACGGRSDATLNSLPDTFGAIQNLSFFWDDPELKDMPKVRTTAFTAANGTTKMRSMVHRNGQVGLAPVKKFTLICTLLTNHSIFDGVANSDRHGDAGPARTLELVVPDLVSDPNKMEKSIAADLLEKLDHHYGQMGHLWARYISMNGDALNERVKVWRQWFADQCVAPAGIVSPPAERFWRGMCAAIMAASEAARANLQVPFEIDRMAAYLVQEFKRNQADVLELNLVTAGGSAVDVDGTVSDYLNLNSSVTVTTDVWQQKKGAQITPVNVIKPMAPINVAQARCSIHIARTDRLIRISLSHFKAWCSARKIVEHRAVIRGILERYSATKHERQTLAARTDWASAQQAAIHIPVPPGSPFEDLLDANVTQAVLTAEQATANDNAKGVLDRGGAVGESA